jgi:hypothetical protein
MYFTLCSHHKLFIAKIFFQKGSELLQREMYLIYLQFATPSTVYQKQLPCSGFKNGQIYVKNILVKVLAMKLYTDIK